jgi:hypothetical protein
VGEEEAAAGVVPGGFPRDESRSCNSPSASISNSVKHIFFFMLEFTKYVPSLYYTFRTASTVESLVAIVTNDLVNLTGLHSTTYFCCLLRGGSFRG